MRFSRYMTAALGGLSLLALTAALPATAQTQALDVTDGQESVSGGNDTWGWSFNLLTTVEVTELGIFDFNDNGLANRHNIGLWASDGTPLTSATIDSGLSGTAVVSISGLGSFRYVDAPNVILTPGTYVLGASYVEQDADHIIQLASSTVMAAGFTFDAGANAASVGFNFPSTFNFGNSFFGPNLRFNAVSTAAPEPGSLALALVALTGIAVARRRKAAA